MSGFHVMRESLSVLLCETSAASCSIPLTRRYRLSLVELADLSLWWGFKWWLATCSQDVLVERGETRLEGGAGRIDMV